MESALDHLTGLGEETETTVAVKPAAPVLSPEEQKKNAQEQRIWTFQFQPLTKDKKPHPDYAAGTFVATIPSIRTRRAIGIDRAALNMGIPTEALDTDTNDMHLMLSTFGNVLDVTQNPESHWSRNFEDVLEGDVLYQLFAEVDQHAATFRKRRETTG